MPSSASELASAGYTPEQISQAISSLYTRLAVLPAPGMSNIKKNDIGIKVRAIVPPAFKHQFPEPKLEVKIRREEEEIRQA